VRAIVLDLDRQPRLVETREPRGRGLLVRVRACGLCGSDVEKIGRAKPGTVLGHEVVAELADGHRVALVHHRPCGRCERCRTGHESTCERFRKATIVPGGFAERARAREWVELPDKVGDALGSFAEPLACVLRGADRLPRGRVLVVGGGFVGRLFEQVLRRRGDEVYVHDLRPERDGPRADGPVDAAVLCARAGGYGALSALEPGGTLLVFAEADELDPAVVYRKELSVLGCRSATPAHLREAVALLPKLKRIRTKVLPLEQFGEGLELYRSGRALKVVFTP